MSDDRLRGKVALVTGASRGIGRAVALALASAGADVAVNYHCPPTPEFGRHNDEDAAEVVEAIQKLGVRTLPVRADVSSRRDVEQMVHGVTDSLGALDILVNNAGICPFHDFIDMPEELWDRVHAVNLKGTFLCSQAAARAMIRQGRGGRIIAMSSISALVGGAQQAHYTATKAGIHSLMQSMAISLGPHGITCNSVMPGAILTAINTDDLSDEAKRAYFEKRIPLGRTGEPDDVAGPVVFLASDEARYMTGSSLLVDGGMFVNLQ
ncbi:MAG TPA: 3-oxoacyl-ACP reductase family protein [Nocardioidaceae bacterium]|jgi:L-rhamnose 1-dehydrogenase